MRVLITGGAGLIGSTVADRLVARGDEVTAIDNLASGRQENVHDKASLRIESVASADDLEGRFNRFRPTVVLHAAASYRDPHDWEEDVMTNVLGMVNVVREAERCGVKRLVYLQTSHCYWTPSGAPPVPTSIDQPVRPGPSSYAITKTAGADLLHLSDLDWIEFRLSYVYGPRSVNGVFPVFYKRIAEGKRAVIYDTRRDLVFVEDAADLIVRALDGRGERGVYHLATGRETRIIDIWRAMVAGMGRRLQDVSYEERTHVPADLETICLDPSKTEAAFDWRATTPLEVGIAKTIAWCRTHEIPETFTHLPRDLFE